MDGSWADAADTLAAVDEAADYFLATREEVWQGYYVLAAATVALPFWLLRRFATPLMSWVVLAMCGLGWAISLSMIVLAPLDLSLTFHQRCLHTELEWAGRFELRANETYSWELEPTAQRGTRYTEQTMYAVLMPWGPEEPELEESFVRLRERYRCGEDDGCTGWVHAPAVRRSGSTLESSGSRLYQLEMNLPGESAALASEAPPSTLFTLRVERSGACARPLPLPVAANDR